MAMKMSLVHEHNNMIAKLKRVVRNIVVEEHGQLVPEPACGLGLGFVRFDVDDDDDDDESAVAEGLDEVEEKETDETMGSGVTSSVEEFWAFKYEEPPPRTCASDRKFQPFALIIP